MMLSVRMRRVRADRHATSGSYLSTIRFSKLVAFLAVVEMITWAAPCVASSVGDTMPSDVLSSSSGMPVIASRAFAHSMAAVEATSVKSVANLSEEIAPSWMNHDQCWVAVNADAQCPHLTTVAPMKQLMSYRAASVDTAVSQGITEGSDESESGPFAEAVQTANDLSILCKLEQRFRNAATYVTSMSMETTPYRLVTTMSTMFSFFGPVYFLTTGFLYLWMLMTGANGSGSITLLQPDVVHNIPTFCEEVFFSTTTILIGCFFVAILVNINQDGMTALYWDFTAQGWIWAFLSPCIMVGANDA